MATIILVFVALFFIGYSAYLKYWSTFLEEDNLELELDIKELKNILEEISDERNQWYNNYQSMWRQKDKLTKIIGEFAEGKPEKLDKYLNDFKSQSSKKGK